MHYLVKKSGGKSYSKPVQIIKDPSSTKLNKGSLKVLELLSQKPMSPGEVAETLKIHEQKIYYYIRSLLKSGLISIVREEQSRGAVKRYYSANAAAFCFETGSDYSETVDDSVVREFFSEFVSSGVFSGSFVISAPFQHGPFLTSARDGHTAVQLAFFLGRYCYEPERFIVKLDTDVKAEHEEKRNMILIGGPVTNMLSNEVNEAMKIHFSWKNSWYLESSLSGKTYMDEDCALIAKIENPWDSSKKIILISGLKLEGTKAAIIGLTQFYDKVLEKYEKGKSFYCIVRSLDKDGDGKTDDIQILESSAV